MHHRLFFHGETLHLMASGALYWPGRRLLVVADLHLGKSERLARRGGALLPPYETQATLAKLDRDLAATDPATVICLGDSFDDPAAAAGLGEWSRLWLTRRMAECDWIWIAGNHDPGPVEIGGSQRAAFRMAPFSFRHVANPAESAEISGHYHPKARLVGQARPCFLADAARVILPAYGVYTGGLAAHHAVLTALMAPDALAILTGNRALAIPMPR